MLLSSDILSSRQYLFTKHKLFCGFSYTGSLFLGSFILSLFYLQSCVIVFLSPHAASGGGLCASLDGNQEGQMMAEGQWEGRPTEPLP